MGVTDGANKPVGAAERPGDLPPWPRPGEQIAELPVGPPAVPPALPICVEFKGVSKTYFPGTRREVTTLHDVNFVVEDLPDVGELITILGPSGCGKSTLLRIIAGLEPHWPQTTGEVLVRGRPVAGPGADRGMVFQDYTSFDHRTVLDNVAFGLECRGVPRAERRAMALTWLEKVGLDPTRDAGKYPYQLSGGMRQRVAIARTLILKPSIILMDEPFGALDPGMRMKMQDLLIDLWREVKATVFFVTHSIEEAVFLGDRVYVMSNAPGTIIREVRTPRPDRSAKIMQREPKFQEVVYSLRDMIDTLEEQRMKTAAASGKRK